MRVNQQKFIKIENWNIIKWIIKYKLSLEYWFIAALITFALTIQFAIFK